MKRRFVAILMCICLASPAGLTACSLNDAASIFGATSTEAGTNANTKYAGKTIYGKVTGTEKNTINLTLGTKKSGSSEVTLSKKKATISVDSDTKVTMSGAPGNPPSGNSNSSGSDKAPTPPQGGGSESAPGGSMTVSSLKKEDVVAIKINKKGKVTSVKLLSGTGGPGSGSTSGPGSAGTNASSISYKAVKSIKKSTTIKNKAIKSTGKDESAVLTKNGAKVTLKNVKITRTSSSSTGGDNSSFYGVGAAVLTTNGTTCVKNSTIKTDAAGGAGVFSYGKGVSYVSDSTITTKKDTSGGIHVAGGGKLYSTNNTVTTNGNSSAAIRSDRGGGTIVVKGGSYTSNGTGSPAIYSTADITATDARLTATGSEAVCIEGANSVTLNNCKLSGNMKDDEQNDCTWNVILYQSMSGDSEEGNSTFKMNGGSLKTTNGGTFYTTNTQSTFVLKDVDITYPSDNDFFLKATGNSNKRGWGTSGKNGADCSFTAISQDMKGDVIWDSISTLKFYMTDGSTLKGAVKDDESNAGSGGNGSASLYIDSDSTWIVTGDSSLTNLYNAGTIKDSKGNKVTIKGTDGTVYVKGDSEYTITVSTYKTTADLSGAESL